MTINSISEPATATLEEGMHTLAGILYSTHMQAEYYMYVPAFMHGHHVGALLAHTMLNRACPRVNEDFAIYKNLLRTLLADRTCMHMCMLSSAVVEW